MLTSRLYNIDFLADAQEFYHSRGWTDGLPIVPPTPEAVQACLQWAKLGADTLIGIEPVRERSETAHGVHVHEGEIRVAWQDDDSNLDGTNYILTAQNINPPIRWVESGNCIERGYC